MKKNIAITLAVLLVAFTLCACAASSEKAAEKMIENITGQKVDIEDGGDSITIKGNDGESMTVTTGGDQAWPTDKLGDLPELKGKIISVIEAGGTCHVSLEDVSEADIKAYIQELKDMGYADGSEYSDEDGMIVFSGTKDDHQATVSYYPEGGSGAGMSSVDISYASKQ